MEAKCQSNQEFNGKKQEKRQSKEVLWAFQLPLGI
jgi:hypothetical protein